MLELILTWLKIVEKGVSGMYKITEGIVYPSQVFAIMKSSSFKREIGLEVEEMQAEFVLRKKSLIRLGLSLVRKYFRRGR